MCLMKLFSEVKLSHRAITFQCDSYSAICKANNPTFHAKTIYIYIYIYIYIQYHLVRDMVDDGNGIVEQFDTLHNVANTLTKPMNIGKFKWCCDSMGLINPINYIVV